MTIGVLGAGAGLTFASVWAHGPLPGDPALTRALRALLGTQPEWATWITGTAKSPWLWGTLLVACALAWGVGGGRRALVPAMALAVARGLDIGLRALVFVPRPTAAALQGIASDGPSLASASGSSGLPSTFGLVYGALFGVLLMAPSSTGGHGRLLGLLGGTLIGLGCAARVVLLGHWPSQVLASVLLGAGLAAVVRALLERGGGATSEAHGRQGVGSAT